MLRNLSALPLLFACQAIASPAEKNSEVYQNNIESMIEKMAVGSEQGPFKPSWQSPPVSG